MSEQYFQSCTFSQVVDEGYSTKPRRKIFGSFLYQDTNTYFFSRTNTGKSMLAFQIGLSAATGISFDNCYALHNESAPMKVLIVDLENDPAIISNRHGIVKINTDPLLLENIIYIHENPVVRPVFSYDLLAKIEKAAVEHQAHLIILDNISRILPDLLKADDVARVIEFMKRIRQNIGASFLVIGHTTKTDHRTAITPQSYYGSSSLQNFFPEIFFLDATKDGRFFLCHAKTKREECYIDNVPVFTRGDHPVAGIGFTFQQIQALSDIQLPMALSTRDSPKRRSLSNYKEEISILDNAGVKRSRIAELCGVSKSAITQFFES
jgi:RecA-family ATPase